MWFEGATNPLQAFLMRQWPEFDDAIELGFEPVEIRPNLPDDVHPSDFFNEWEPDLIPNHIPLSYGISHVDGIPYATYAKAISPMARAMVAVAVEHDTLIHWAFPMFEDIWDGRGACGEYVAPTRTSVGIAITCPSCLDEFTRHNPQLTPVKKNSR